jgi:energy-coupling factor transport system permease protein
VYFLTVIGAAMFVSNPILRLIALVFAVVNGGFARIFRSPLKDFSFYLLIFVIITLSNPLFVRRGSTPLFYINERPFTLEAMLYGADMAVMLISTLIWFRIFSQIMTSDKISALFGRHFSSIGIVLTLVLRFVPTFKRRFGEIRSAQTAAGFLSGETFFQRVRSELNVFFSLTASSLELSAGTADSMKARGFSVFPHTDLHKKTPCLSDIFTLTICVLTAFAVIFFGINGSSSGSFYPVIQIKNNIFCDILYAILCALPTIFEVKERLKWHFCGVKI